jgi:hypothetical protein
MYPDAQEFLVAERAAWVPYRALASLTDEQLSQPIAAAHNWSGRDLMGHFIVWHEKYLIFIDELRERGYSESKVADDAYYEERGEELNDEYVADFAKIPLAELRARFDTTFESLRNRVAPLPVEVWQRNVDFNQFLPDVTIGHYAGHTQDLAAILAPARSASHILRSDAGLLPAPE